MHVNRTETRADHFKITDYEVRKDGTPIMIEVPGGTVVDKQIEYYTTTCPECIDEHGNNTIEAWVDQRGDEICPVCGVVCAGPNKQVVPEDSSFASRGGWESSGFPALNDAAPVHSTDMAGGSEASPTSGDY